MIFEVTGAALSPNGEHLALLGATRLWLFSNFSNGNFFDGNVQIINYPIGQKAQKLRREPLNVRGKTELVLHQLGD